MVRKNLVKLEEICEDYKFVLLDNSSLWSVLNSNIEEGSRDFLREKQEMTKNTLLYFCNQIKSFSQIHLTQKIYDEANIRGIKKDKQKYNSSGLKRYQNMKNSVSLAKKRFLKEMKKQGRIISFADSEKVLYERFFHKNKSLAESRDLSGPDYDLLISGIILSLKRGKTAILTNDFPLLNAYRYICKNRKIKTSQCGAFVHNLIGYFSKYDFKS